MLFVTNIEVGSLATIYKDVSKTNIGPSDLILTWHNYTAGGKLGHLYNKISHKTRENDNNFNRPKTLQKSETEWVQLKDF